MSWKYPPLPVTATFAAKRKRNWGRPNSRLRSCRWPPGRCETQSQLPPRCGIGPGRPSRPGPRFPLPHPAFTALPSPSHCRVSAQAALGFCPGVCAASGAPPSSLRVFPSRPPLEKSPTPQPRFRLRPLLSFRAQHCLHLLSSVCPLLVSPPFSM